MKKYKFILTLFLILFLSACGSEDSGKDSKDTPESQDDYNYFEETASQLILRNRIGEAGATFLITRRGYPNRDLSDPDPRCRVYLTVTSHRNFTNGFDIQLDNNGDWCNDLYQFNSGVASASVDEEFDFGEISNDSVLLKFSNFQATLSPPSESIYSYSDPGFCQ